LFFRTRAIFDRNPKGKRSIGIEELVAVDVPDESQVLHVFIESVCVFSPELPANIFVSLGSETFE
jgi:hypothetical protein